MISHPPIDPIPELPKWGQTLTRIPANRWSSSVPTDAWDWAQPQIAHYLLDCSRLLDTPKPR
jgi:hypothetical protein